MRAFLAIAGLGIRQNLRSPLITGLLVIVPIMLIFVVGEAMRNVIPGSSPYPYVTVTILSQVIAHSAVVGFWCFQKESHHNTLNRVSVAPVTALIFVGGSFLAGFVSITAFVGAVTAGVALFFRVPMGPSPGALAAVVVCGSAFSASLGSLFGGIFREERYARMLAFLIPVLILLGGGYFPLPERGPLAAVSRYIPVRWITDALRELLLTDGAATEWRTVLLCIPVTVALVTLAVIAMRRRWR